MKNVVFILVCCFVEFGFSQNLNIINQYDFGGSGDDFMSLTRLPNNDGFIAIGTSDSNISGVKTENSRGQDDVWILKLDNDFNVIWDKTIGGSLSESGGGGFWLGPNEIFILVGSNSPISGEKLIDSFGNHDIWLLCLDYSGNLLWQEQYGGDMLDTPFKLIEYSDTSLMIIGDSQSGISGNKTTANIGSRDLWLIEVSKFNGNKIQEKTLGSQFDEYRGNIVLNPYNSHLYINSTAYTGLSDDKTDLGYGSYDMWLVELDENLDVVRNKCFGGSNEDFGGAEMLFEEGFFYVLSTSRSSNDGNKSTVRLSVNALFEDMWFIKLDYNFNIIWDKAYGGNKSDLSSSFFKNVNGNFVLSASSDSYGGTGNKTSVNFANNEYDLWLLILDGNGTILAQESYGSLSSDVGYVIPGNNPGDELIWASYSSGSVGGVKSVNTYGGNDLWVLEIDASDFLSTNSLNSSNQSVAVYPNPFSTEVNFKFRNLKEAVTISFYSLDGRLLDEVNVDPAFNDVYTWKNVGTESMILYSIDGDSVHYKGKLVR